MYTILNVKNSLVNRGSTGGIFLFEYNTQFGLRPAPDQIIYIKANGMILAIIGAIATVISAGGVFKGGRWIKDKYGPEGKKDTNHKTRKRQTNKDENDDSKNDIRSRYYGEKWD